MWTGPRGQQANRNIDPFNETRRSLHLPPLASYGELQASAAAHLVPTAAALDEPVPWDLPLHYIGPLQPLGEDGDLPDLPARFVLVSLSTTWQGQVDVLQQIVEALAPLDRSVVVTTGPAIAPSEITPAANTIVAANLPHLRILHRVDAVVTHAGHGTVLSALTAGVPLVCMPMGRDQHDVTRRVVAVGAGVEVDPESVSQDLLPALQRVISDARFADNARQVARSIAEHGGIEAALAIIDRCAHEHLSR